MADTQEAEETNGNREMVEETLVGKKIEVMTGKATATKDLRWIMDTLRKLFQDMGSLLVVENLLQWVSHHQTPHQLTPLLGILIARVHPAQC